MMITTLPLHRWLLAGCAILTASFAAAQTAAATFSIPDREIDVQFGKTLQRTKRVMIPTVNVEVMNWGKISSVTQTSALQSLGGASNSSVRSTMEVAVPSDAAAFRVVAGELFDDLATKLRAAGWEVTPQEEMKSEPTVAGLKQENVDVNLGAPMRKVTVGKQKMHYTVVAPAGMPVIDGGMLSPLWPLRNTLRDRNTNGLHVYYRFDPVALQGQSKHGIGRNTASTSAEANLVLSAAQGDFITPKGDLGRIRLKNPVAVVGGVGELKKAADVSPELANGISKALSFLGGGSITSQKGLYVCELDHAALKASLLVAGKAFNDEIVQAFGKAP